MSQKSRPSFLISFSAALLAVICLLGGVWTSVSRATTNTISVWWPTNLANISGTQPFQALVNSMDVNSYFMFWEVDYGAYNIMPTNLTNYPHKEADVNVSSWNWQPSGNYTLAFIAQNLAGQEIARTTMQVHVQGNFQSVVPVAPTPAPTPISVTSSANVFSGSTLYVNPNSTAKQLANTLQNLDSYDSSLLNQVAKGATAQWFGNWNTSVATDVDSVVTAAHNAHSLPVLVAYDIPNRDCGGYSGNGAVSATAYQQWISAFASGIKNRSAVVILEPDSTAQIDCLSASELQTRYALLSSAITTLKSAGATVYLDAGNSNWISASVMAARLKEAGIANADGFSLNVSNYYASSDNETFGQTLSALIGNKHFIVDTSRNGNGAPTDGQWCNSSGRALGSLPTAATGNSLVDAFLWIKAPGESDGSCNSGPSAGTFWPAYAEQLAANRHW